MSPHLVSSKRLLVNLMPAFLSHTEIQEDYERNPGGYDRSFHSPDCHRLQWPMAECDQVTRLVYWKSSLELKLTNVVPFSGC